MIKPWTGSDRERYLSYTYTIGLSDVHSSDTLEDADVKEETTYPCY